MEWVILSGKGGTGKTTVASALIHLSDVDHYADCDVDAPNLHLTTHSGNNPKSYPFYGMKKALIDSNICQSCGKCYESCRFNAIKVENSTYSIDKERCEGCGVCEFVCPFDAIQMTDHQDGTLILYDNHHRFSTATLRMGSHHSGLLVSQVKNQLYEHIKPSFSIVDGSPGIGCPVQASLVGASLAILVTEPTMSAIADLKRLVTMIEAYRVDMAVIINKADLSAERVEEIILLCKDHSILLAGLIPFDRHVIEAVNQGKSVIEMDTDAAVALRSIYETLKNHYILSKEEL